MALEMPEMNKTCSKAAGLFEPPALDSEDFDIDDLPELPNLTLAKVPTQAPKFPVL
jgi:hypothetical protein